MFLNKNDDEALFKKIKANAHFYKTTEIKEVQFNEPDDPLDTAHEIKVTDHQNKEFIDSKLGINNFSFLGTAPRLKCPNCNGNLEVNNIYYSKNIKLRAVSVNCALVCGKAYLFLQGLNRNA